MSKKLLGIDLGGTTIKFAIVTTKGQITKQWSIKTNILDAGNCIIPDMIESITEHLKLERLTTTDFLGIGIGTPGSVNYKEGTVNNAFNLNWDHQVNIKTELEAQLKMPVLIENDANVAALGEQWQGAGENSSNMAFVTLGTGVGGGIIINDQIVHGIGGAAGEIGHMIIDPQGYLCTCGKKGCLETIASARGIVHLSYDLAERYAASSALKDLIAEGQDISAKNVLDLAKENDELALQILQIVSDNLGQALANISVTINPEYIIIGGGVSNAGTFLLDKVQQAYDKYVFAGVRNTTRLRLATLGNSAGVLGAASLVVINQ
ncbi:ROK family glucokinase [Bombilactobacillus thymidiniphilus]|uniref:Glucokinase n=1 Tax=Bombilactobacillus thymidiniphilus TaxID=2923363 RepID=A0ABY4PC93_9LACO|nr:ROK family glucokinase [Bombilactobacillus thymidiniphilus]UQS83388.1 ROK family glucokinase [Bombilactobacillus thymidiniphilus]